MPTWLVHGFRWPRPLIRIHIILQNLDDAAAEWLMAPPTVNAILANFHTLYPEPMANLASLRFIEQYDTEDMTTKDQPYAYVCDQVHEVRLGLDIDDVRGKGVANEAWTALADLRDKIAPGEKIGWFVVVNGDVERWAPAEENTDAMNDTAFKGSTDESMVSPVSVRSSMSRGDDREDKEPRGLKKWFKARRIKSFKDLRTESALRSFQHSPPPPLPKLPLNGTTPPPSRLPTTRPLPLRSAMNGRVPMSAGSGR